MFKKSRTGDPETEGARSDTGTRPVRLSGTASWMTLFAQGCDPPSDQQIGDEQREPRCGQQPAQFP